MRVRLINLTYIKLCDSIIVMEKKQRERRAICDRHTGQPLLRTELKIPGTPLEVLLPVHGTYLGHHCLVDLRTADFREIDLRGANVSGKDLSDADLTGAVLDGLKFDVFTRWPAGFDPVRLGAVKIPPDLGGLSCIGRNFDGLDLTRATFAGGDASGASFVGTNLSGANLINLNLTGANLTGANLTRARFNHSTRWPEGFVPPSPPGKEPETVEVLAGNLKALGDPSRLRLLGLLLREPQTGEELAAALGLTEATVTHHISKLREAGLAETQNRMHQACPDAVRALGEGLGERLRKLMATEEPADKFVQKVLATFFDSDARLLHAIPARQKKQRIVLERLVAEFEPGVRYTEMQLSEKLRAFQEDVATLRRLFVAERLMARENGVYWRL